MKKIVICGVGLLLLGSACARTAVVHTPPVSQPSSTFTAWSHSGGAEKRVCVLPFTNRTQSTGLAARVREGFFGRLALKRFTDVELRELDAQLQTLPEVWSQLSPRQLGQALQCDALVYGEITEASNLYLGVYAQLTLEGRIQFVDASSNETLVIGSHATKFRTGGVPFSLLAVVPNAVLNLRNFTSEQSLRAVDDLARNLADKIPDLPTGSADDPVAAEPFNSLEGREQRKASIPVIATVAPDRYRVQVAAFSQPGEAQHVAQRLRDEGFRPMVVIATTDERLWHKVLLGPFPSLDIAQETGVRVRQRLHISPMVVRTQ
ncbi:MAG: SPOR domain-containing protein [Candidatus Binatia bacterium]